MQEQCEAASMAAPKKQKSRNLGTQVTTRLSAEMMDAIEEIQRKAGFGARAEIMRQALEVGLAAILKRYGSRPSG